MRRESQLPAFPEYLKRAISRAGFDTPTDFAREAGISSSVVSRWLNGQVRPDVPLLERVAPFLGTKVSTLVRLAYPEINDDGLPIEESTKLDPLAAELDRRLGERSKLTEEEKDTLRRLVNSVLTQYRARRGTRKAPS